jgi:hypothetical protein
MINVKAIVFSYNRAIFLDTFLKSFYKHNKNENFEITVIYNTSNEEYEEGYKILKNKYNFDFIKEKPSAKKITIDEMMYPRNILRFIKYEYYRKNRTNFKEILIELLESTNLSNFVFFTDDSVFYRDFYIDEKIFREINENPDDLSLHLRFGENYSSKPEFYEVEDGYIYWNTYETSDKDWGYKFSVDGQIYNKNFLIKNLKKILFINPTTLEGNINYYLMKKKLMKRGICFRQSCLIGFEINKVQKITNNFNMNIDNASLNKYYLEGYEMEYSYSDEIRSFRPELKNIFIKKGEEIKTIIHLEK